MTYQPGSYFLTAIAGPTGWLIGTGQALAGAPSRFSHAGIVLDTDGTILEAEPGGARLGHLDNYRDGRPLLVSDAPVQRFVARQMSPLTDMSDPRAVDLEMAVRHTVTVKAEKLIGVPYSALDYAALAALHLHLPSRWIRNRVKSSGHMICSQLVDAIYERAGIHLYSDGRYPGDVMPSDLASWAEDHAMEVTR